VKEETVMKLTPLAKRFIMRTAVTLAAVLVSTLSLLTLPSDVARSAGERVVLDATLHTIPAQDTSLCMEIAAGTLTATLQSVGDPNARVVFLLGPRGSGTFPGEYVNTMVPTVPVTYQTAVRQPVTCVGLLDESDRWVVGSVHKVAVTIVWSPPAP
jgi:hypothetical protein